MKNTITSRNSDYSQWYLDIIKTAELAEHSDVRGFMIIKPYGYAIWENIKNVLDKKIKETGHKNAYFPLLIPKSFISQEAKHVSGFAKEMAVVTHHRLINENGEIVVDPEAKLEEELIVRPTSETIINATFSRWIESWRDLPLLINQWANVVRWELRPRLFLRSTEFLWQEGHTAHSTSDEAAEETEKMLNVYREFLEGYLAIPVLIGKKSPQETFAGADYTLTIEALMQDGKALQAGTSHNLGQNFAKAFEIKFTDNDGQVKHVWQTSWGVSTRLVGGLIMMHSDDQGLVLPPKIAPTSVVIIPIWKDDEKREAVEKAAKAIKDDLESKLEDYPGKIIFDDRDHVTPGYKFNEWEKKGVPVRIEIGPKDLESDSVIMVQRDNGNKGAVAIEGLGATVFEALGDIQTRLLEKARNFVRSSSHEVDNYDDFKRIIEDGGGFIYAHWCGLTECEAAINSETKATIRCLSLEAKNTKGSCLYCGNESEVVAVFAKAY